MRYSGAGMPAVRDIDASTATDPLYFTDYVNDMFEHYRQQEVCGQRGELPATSCFIWARPGSSCIAHSHTCARSRWLTC